MPTASAIASTVAAEPGRLAALIAWELRHDRGLPPRDPAGEPPRPVGGDSTRRPRRRHGGH